MMLRGDNLFPGTTVVLGDRKYRLPEDGLLIKSEKTLELNAPREAFLNDAVLNGRYGPSKLIHRAPNSKAFPRLTTEWLTVQ